MPNAELNIIKLFSDKPDVELTIHQISKNIKKSYAFTNKYAHAMIKQDLLKKKVIGNAIVCSLNKDNEQLIGLLVMDSINKKMQFEHSLKDSSKTELSTFLKDISDVKTVFMSDSSITIVSDKLNHNLSNKKIAGFKINTVDYTSFLKTKIDIELSSVIVLKNHEQFWSMIHNVSR